MLKSALLHSIVARAPFFSKIVYAKLFCQFWMQQSIKIASTLILYVSVVLLRLSFGHYAVHILGVHQLW